MLKTVVNHIKYKQRLVNRRYNFSRNRSSTPRRAEANVATKSAESKVGDDEPLFQTKTKVKMGLVATGGILCYLYNKLNNDPKFRLSVTAKAPGVMNSIGSVVTIDRVKMEDIKPPTVWDDIEEWGNGVDYNLPRQMVYVTTKKGTSPFPVLADAKDNSVTLRGKLIAAGMSTDDEVLDITIHDNKSNNNSSSNNNNSNDVKKIHNSSTGNDDLKELNEQLATLRRKEKETQSDIAKFNTIEGGKTKVFMLKSTLNDIQRQKATIKSKIRSM
jgi:hypothetical protein